MDEKRSEEYDEEVKQSPMKERNQSIDIVKGIGIILMILGHSYSTDAGKVLLRYVYSFHMPLFFITSGVLCGIKNSGKEIHFQRKIHTLLVPYLIYATLYQLFLAVLSIIGGSAVKDTLVYRAKLVVTMEGSALWFLPVMFLAGLLFSWTIRKKSINLCCTLAAMIIGIWGPNVSGIAGCGIRALVGFGFISIGYYLYRFFAEKKLPVVLLVALIVYFWGMMSQNETVDLADHSFGNPYLYILESVLGTFLVYQFSIFVPKRNRIIHFVEQIGKYSIIFLCLHGFMIQMIRLLDYKLFHIFSHLGIWEGIILTFVVTGAIFIMLPVILKYFGWTYGIAERSE